MTIYDLESSNTDRAVPNAFGSYKLSKITSKSYRDITQHEFEKRRNDGIVLKGTDCNKYFVRPFLGIKGEPQRVKNKIGSYILYFLAHKECGFHSVVVLSSLFQWRTIVSLINNESDIVF